MNVHKTSPGRLMYVQFTFCVYVDIILDVTIITGKNVNGILLNNISFFFTLHVDMNNKKTWTL